MKKKYFLLSPTGSFLNTNDKVLLCALDNTTLI